MLKVRMSVYVRNWSVYFNLHAIIDGKILLFGGIDKTGNVFPFQVEIEDWDWCPRNKLGVTGMTYNPKALASSLMYNIRVGSFFIIPVIYRLISSSAWWVRSSSSFIKNITPLSCSACSPYLHRWRLCDVTTSAAGLKAEKHCLSIPCSYLL